MALNGFRLGFSGSLKNDHRFSFSQTFMFCHPKSNLSEPKDSDNSGPVRSVQSTGSPFATHFGSPALVLRNAVLKATTPQTARCVVVLGWCLVTFPSGSRANRLLPIEPSPSDLTLWSHLYLTSLCEAISFWPHYFTTVQSATAKCTVYLYITLEWTYSVYLVLV